MRDESDNGPVRNTRRERLADALQDFFVDRKPTSYIVLAFNREIKMEVARRALSVFSMMVDRYCLGRDFSKSRRKRFDYIATPEHVDSNFHWNLAGRLPSKLKRMGRPMAQAVFSDLFKRICPSGTVKYRRVFDSERLAKYITKEVPSGGVLETFVIASEFHRRQKRCR